MRVVMLHKIVNNLVDIAQADHLLPTEHQYITRGAHIKFQLPRTRLNVFQNSFFPSAIAMWNNLPASTTAVTDPEAFRAGLEAVRLSH